MEGIEFNSEQEEFFTSFTFGYLQRIIQTILSDCVEGTHKYKIALNWINPSIPPDVFILIYSHQ